jgi:hypothetical protein
MEPLKTLPEVIQMKWHAQLHQGDDDPRVGIYNLVDIEPAPHPGQQIEVLVLDENERPIPNIDVVFSYDTGNFIILEGEWYWTPPSARRGDVVRTGGDGTAVHTQGSVVKDDEPGGITVWIKDPQRACDWVTGLGMLSDHTGIRMIYKRKDVGVESDRAALILLRHYVLRVEQQVHLLKKRVELLEQQAGGMKVSAVNYEKAD